MYILGIDPGTERMGFAIIEKGQRAETLITSGLISTPKTTSPGERLRHISLSLKKILNEHTITAAGVEKLFFSKNITTAMRVSEARGVVLLELQNHNIPIYEYTPTKIKSAVVGYGNASKEQVGRMVQTILNLKSPLTPDDVADAAAIALCVSGEQKNY